MSSFQLKHFCVCMMFLLSFNVFSLMLYCHLRLGFVLIGSVVVCSVVLILVCFDNSLWHILYEIAPWFCFGSSVG